MSDDVTIPCEMAKDIANYLRYQMRREGMPMPLAGYADHLDPPQQPSLRDEVYTAIWDAWQSAASSTVAAASARDAVLAVVQKRVHAMPTRRSLDGLTPQGCYERAIYDVLDLLGVTDE